MDPSRKKAVKMMEELDWTVPDSVELMTKEEVHECISHILELLAILDAALDDESAPP